MNRPFNRTEGDNDVTQIGIRDDYRSNDQPIGLLLAATLLRATCTRVWRPTHDILWLRHGSAAASGAGAELRLPIW